MEHIEWIQRLAQSAGPVGLFLLSIADSAGIPTGGGPDVLLVLQSSIVDHTRTVAVLVAIAAVGSTAGCLAMYYVGRRSGRVALRRFSEQRVEGIRRRLKRHGPGHLPRRHGTTTLSDEIVCFVCRCLRYETHSIWAQYTGRASHPLWSGWLSWDAIRHRGARVSASTRCLDRGGISLLDDGCRCLRPAATQAPNRQRFFSLTYRGAFGRTWRSPLD
jgi:membrane protein YqaA with SNARE-associated domain